MTTVLPGVREHAERASSMAHVRLLWRKAFCHPYAYAGGHRLVGRGESLASCGGGPPAAGKDRLGL
jgi:hypothetical protein